MEDSPGENAGHSTEKVEERKNNGSVVAGGREQTSSYRRKYYLEHREKAAEYRKRQRERERERKLKEQKARLERIERERDRITARGRNSIIKLLDSLSDGERREWIRMLFPGLDGSTDPDEWYEAYKKGLTWPRKDPEQTRKEKLMKNRDYYKEHRAEILEKKRQYDRANRAKISERREHT